MTFANSCRRAQVAGKGVDCMNSQHVTSHLHNSLMIASALQSQAKVWKSPRNGAMSAVVTSALELAGPVAGGKEW